MPLRHVLPPGLNLKLKTAKKQVTGRNPNEAEELLHHLNLALVSPTPFAPPVPPPERCSPETVQQLAEALLSAVGLALRISKESGRMNAILATKDASTSGIALKFPSPKTLHRLLVALGRGEVIDPCAPYCPESDHGFLATYCGADGGYAKSIYEEACSVALKRGKTFSQVVCVVLTNYINEFGEIGEMRSFGMEP